MNYLIVFLGAGFGGMLRLFISTYLGNSVTSSFPLGTLAVNFIGSFILGFLIFGLDEKELLSNNMKILIGVGFCGGLTTFSTFSLETFNLMRDSEFLLAAVNIGGNLLLSFAGVISAYFLLR